MARTVSDLPRAVRARPVGRTCEVRNRAQRHSGPVVSSSPAHITASPGAVIPRSGVVHAEVGTAHIAIFRLAIVLRGWGQRARLPAVEQMMSEFLARYETGASRQSSGETAGHGGADTAAD